jgi:hypothetical protein
MLCCLPGDESSLEKAREPSTTSSPNRIEDHSYAATDKACSSCIDYQRQLDTANRNVAELHHRVSSLKAGRHGQYVCRAFIDSDKKVRLNTGLPNKRTLNSLFGLLKGRALKMRYWIGTKRIRNPTLKRSYIRTPTKCGPRRALSCKDEFVLTLMKLRMGLTTSFLANVFGIGTGTCSSIFNTWVKFLARELKCLIFWPSKEQIRTFMPKSLRVKYPNLRCIIDCSETFIERPRDLKLQSCTWSDYKQHNTMKYLIAITPDGLISFVSPSFGGRTTDRYIVQNSGFLDLIEHYDLILADRGFTIREDLLFRMATLEIPPASSGISQMSTASRYKMRESAHRYVT